MSLYKFMPLALLAICLSISACQENEPTETQREQGIDTNNLIGEWKVIEAERDGEKLNSIEDAVFIFDKNNTLTLNSNFPGMEKDQPNKYTLEELTIKKVGSFELDFEILALDEQTLTLLSKIQGSNYTFVLER